MPIAPSMMAIRFSRISPSGCVLNLVISPVGLGCLARLAIFFAQSRAFFIIAIAWTSKRPRVRSPKRS